MNGLSCSPLDKILQESKIHLINVKNDDKKLKKFNIELGHYLYEVNNLLSSSADQSSSEIEAILLRK